MAGFGTELLLFCGLARLIHEAQPSEEFWSFWGEGETICDNGKTWVGNED